MSTLAERRAWHLSRLMREQGLTPTTLALAAGLDGAKGREGVASMLRGVQPRDAKLEAIATALEADPGTFHQQIPPKPIDP